MAHSGQITVGIAGAGGYAGQVLHALLMHHPCMRPTVIARTDDTSTVDERGDEWGHERGALGPNVADTLAQCDAVALAVPDAAARAFVDSGAETPVRIVDLSGAYRRTANVHYGLPERNGTPPAAARLIANPGCYPTATLLALGPLVDAGVTTGPIAVVGLSGTSGAGKAMRPDLHFSELHDNAFPYQVGEHKHIPEIEHHLGTSIAFVTELLPLVRGLRITAFVRTEQSPSALTEILAETYAPHPYVSVVRAPGPALGIRHVVGTHQARIAVGPKSHEGLVPVFATIDNLMRGAASQAVHNLNLWFGLDPALGLPAPANPDDNRDLPGMTRMLA